MIDANEPLLWPVTIIDSRYGGSYEDGEWCAFHMEAHEVPPEVTGEDGECRDFFWDNPAAKLVGRGDTPDLAIADLRKRLRVNAISGYEYPLCPLCEVPICVSEEK